LEATIKQNLDAPTPETARPIVGHAKGNSYYQIP